jgi:hypothetical protein
MTLSVEREKQINELIEKEWMEAEVTKLDNPNFTGISGRVKEVIWDEKGALHCRVDDGFDDWWCPVSLLKKKVTE